MKKKNANCFTLYRRKLVFQIFKLKIQLVYVLTRTNNFFRIYRIVLASTLSFKNVSLLKGMEIHFYKIDFNNYYNIFNNIYTEVTKKLQFNDINLLFFVRKSLYIYLYIYIARQTSTFAALSIFKAIFNFLLFLLQNCKCIIFLIIIKLMSCIKTLMLIVVLWMHMNCLSYNVTSDISN